MNATKISPAAKQKLESLRREGKPTRLTIIAIPRAAPGPSGTGKTLAAEVLASLSRPHQTVTSNYIGETEKNLSILLENAERTGTILFFDEADALFGKVAGVRTPHVQKTGNDLRREDATRNVIVLVNAVNSSQRLSPLAAHFRWIDLP